MPVVALAVANKDFRLRMRGWRWAGVASLYVGLLGAAAMAFLLQKYSAAGGSSGSSSPGTAGIRMFQILSIVQLLLILFVTPASVSGAITGERRQATWELLLSSSLRRESIVWAKYVAGVAFNLLLIGASLPLFLLTLLFGGLAPGDLVPAFVVFLITVLLFGSISLTVSASTSRLSVAFLLSLLVALLLVVALSLLTLFLQSPERVGLLELGSVPFGSFNTPADLPWIAQLDPLVALLAALPAESGGTLLGPIGVIHRPFGLPGTLPWWAAYSALSVALSAALLLVAPRLVGRDFGSHTRARTRTRSARPPGPREGAA